MKRLVQFPLEEGGTILVEVDELEPARNTMRGLAPSEVLSMAEHTFEAAMERIKPAAAAIIAKLRELNQPPDIIGVEFRIKLSAGAGAILASASAEANFKVMLT